ncbi:MAG: hypothetical protein WBX19_08960 [Terracidiphilus sp.]
MRGRSLACRHDSVGELSPSQLPPNGAAWGFDYLSRAATARSNMYDNAPQETHYIYTDFDSTNQRLNGSHAYTVTFPPDKHRR